MKAIQDFVKCTTNEMKEIEVKCDWHYSYFKAFKSLKFPAQQGRGQKGHHQAIKDKSGSIRSGLIFFNLTILK